MNADEAAGRVDDAHASIRDALTALDDIPLTALNETEREHALAAVSDLYNADVAISERSTIEPHPKPKDVLGDGGDA